MNNVTLDWNRVSEILHSSEFYWGVVAGVLLLIGLAVLIKVIYFFHRRCKSLIIQEEGGSLELTMSTIQSFLNSVLVRFPNVDVCKACIVKSCSSKRLKLFIKVKQGADMAVIRNEVRTYIVGEFASKLNILDEFKGVDIKVVQMPGSNHLVASQEVKEQPVENAHLEE